MESWISLPGSAPKCAAPVEITVIEIVAIDNRSAVRDIRVVVVDHPVAMPVVSPVIPTPPKSSKQANSKSSAEDEARAVIKDAWHRIPTRVGDKGVAIYEPWII